ncbi:MAG: diadenylate cyclase CdaA [Bacillota bacterium]|nr:diadenylate cyclase CdaA [Bacillota bacterium]
METIIEILLSIRILDILDIIIVSFVFYKLFLLIKGTRAEQLIKGLLIIMVISKLSDIAKLYTVYYILENTMKLGFIALLIVFQPELRKTLEYIGRNKFIQKDYINNEKLKMKNSFIEIIETVKFLSERGIGALIILEKETGLGEYIETGIELDAKISSELLISIFYDKTPLHDGATIISNNRVTVANAYLPLSTNSNLSQELGTRHRAGIGLSEVSDAFIIIVSEETGVISIVIETDLYRNLNEKEMMNMFIQEFNMEVKNKKKYFWNNRKQEV